MIKPLARRRVIGLAAAMLVVAVVGGALWTLRPAPVRAEEIVQNAYAAATNLSAARVHSFELVQQAVTDAEATASPAHPTPKPGDVRSELHVWHAAPDKWRYELRFTSRPGGGSDPTPSVTVSDGQATWSYDPNQRVLQIVPQPARVSGKGGYSPFLFGEPDLATVLQQASTCYTPVVAGEDSVAGREAYVIGLGATRCPRGAAAAFDGPLTIWIDKATFFVLRTELRDSGDKQVLQSRVVTSVRYNPDLEPSLFTFVPPPGSTVLDNRPKSAPSADEFQRQLRQLTEPLDFSVFVPTSVPRRLMPRQPRIERFPAAGLLLEFVPQDEVATSTPSAQLGVGVSERRASAAPLPNWTEHSDEVTINGGRTWIRSRPPGVAVVHDGTLITLESSALSTEELLAIATSLQPFAAR